MEGTIDISVLPKRNDGKIDWKYCVGKCVNFNTHGVKGIIEIKDRYKSKNGRYHLKIKYNDKEKTIDQSKFLRLQIGDLVGIYMVDYRYDIGYTYRINDTTYTIVNRFKDPSKENRKMYGVQCGVCKQIFSKTESDIERTGCPVCANQIVVKGINDMWTTHPDLACLLKNSEDGYKYCSGSNIKLEWICPICGEVIIESPNNVSTRGLVCKIHNGTTSYPNRFFYFLLKQLNIKYESEKRFEWSNGRIYDIYIPSINTIIEAHGIQHYEQTGFAVTLAEQQEIDKYKHDMAIKNGIINYIEVDCRESNREYISRNILNSKISELFDLKDVNWDEVDINASSDVLEQFCTIWNNGIHDLNQIGEKVGYKPNSLYSYMRKARDLSLIEYDEAEMIKRRNAKSYAKKQYKEFTPIICTDNGYVFNTLKTCEKLSDELFGTHILTSCLCVVCKGKKNATKGFHFEYITKQEFNEIKRNTPNKAFGDYFDLSITSNKYQ